jgi:hypothetical protein
MNEQEIKKILQELYTLQPDLAVREQELKKIILKLVADRPQAEINEAFKKELRAEILRQASSPQPWPQEDARGFSLSRLLSVRGLAFSLGGVALIVAGLAVYLNQLGPKPAAQVSTAGLTIDKLSANAFGVLPSQELIQGSGRGAASSDGQGVGGGKTATSTPSTGVAESQPAPAVDVDMIGGVNYKFVYPGNIAPPAERLDVLKRLTGQAVKLETTNLAGALGQGLADIGSFSGTEIQSVSLVQDTDHGYQLDVNFNMGTIAISELWNQWYSNDRSVGSCADPANCATEQLTEADVPDDDALIKLANDFLTEHGVNLDNYGQAQVQNQWRETVEALKFGLVGYIPETIQVLYPLRIGDRLVYTVDGSPSGLYVVVNLRQSRVSYVTGLAVQHYESSPYKTIQEAAQIKSMVEQGGLYANYSYPNAEKTVELSLGDPSVQFVSLSRSDTDGYQEYLVPAYVFPIVKVPEGEQYWQKNIVIPLVEEFYDNQTGGGIEPMPLPLLEREADPAE